MQEAREQRIRENLTALVDLTNNVGFVLKQLKEKAIVSDEDEEKILTASSPFDTKAQLYWLITKKDEAAFQALVEALKSTGNVEAAEMIQDQSQETGVNGSETSESRKSSNPDGIDFDAEKEFERIQSEVETEPQTKPEETLESVIATALVAEVFEEALEKAYDQPEVTVQDEEIQSISDEDDVESEVIVRVTPPPDSDREVEEEIPVSEEPEVTVYVEEEPTKVEEPEFVEEEVKIAEITEEVPKVPENEPEVEAEAEEPPKERKQVKFESEKEFSINDESEESPSLSPNSKSIVQQNREKFEQHAPAGVKVKYSFRKSGEPAPEEPKESTVKNLRNFFQKLGSVDKEDVQTRSGSKMGGVHPNRRTMAL